MRYEPVMDASEKIADAFNALKVEDVFVLTMLVIFVIFSIGSMIV